MKTQETIKIFCYAQHCSSCDGGIVPVSVLEDWFGENDGAEEAGDYCDDWNLIAEGTREEIKAYIEERIASLKNAKFDSNIAFRLRQHRAALEVVS